MLLKSAAKSVQKSLELNELILRFLGTCSSGRFDSRWYFTKLMRSTRRLSQCGNGGSKESTDGLASPGSAAVGVW